MAIEQDNPVTQSDWQAAQASRRLTSRVSAVIMLIVVPLLGVVAMELADLLAEGTMRRVTAFAVFCLLLLPVTGGLYRSNTGQQDRSDDLVEKLTMQLSGALEIADRQAHEGETQARRQEFESRLANALDMAEGEPEVIDVIERSFARTLPDSPVELLLADNSHAHLLRMASASPAPLAPGCGVDSPDHCPAARRAQVQRFSNSDDLDACPKLRGRLDGTISAVCVPVSIMGRTVGVIHATAQPPAPFAEDSVQNLEKVAKLAGARIGLLRVMAETQLQASTDTLTGLLNRRSFEQRLSTARRPDVPVCVAMADLDHFKELNDTYGHETGDRALRLFAQVLTGSLRTQDLICRHGGEEFVVAMMNCTTESARTALDSVRARLDAAITVAGLPTFTVSLGMVQTHEQEDLPTSIARADLALAQAKNDGRDRVVIHDAQGNATPAPGVGPASLRAPASPSLP